MFLLEMRLLRKIKDIIIQRCKIILCRKNKINKKLSKLLKELQKKNCGFTLGAILLKQLMFSNSLLNIMTHLNKIDIIILEDK